MGCAPTAPPSPTTPRCSSTSPSAHPPRAHPTPTGSSPSPPTWTASATPAHTPRLPRQTARPTRQPSPGAAPRRSHEASLRSLRPSSRSVRSSTMAAATAPTSPTTARRAWTPTATTPDRKSTRLNSSHEWISYAVFCLKKKKIGVDIAAVGPWFAAALDVPAEELKAFVDVGDHRLAGRQAKPNGRQDRRHLVEQGFGVCLATSHHDHEVVRIPDQPVVGFSAAASPGPLGVGAAWPAGLVGEVLVKHRQGDVGQDG